MNLLSAWVVLAPGGHELGEVVGPEDGGVTGQVVEAKHQGQGSDKPLCVLHATCCYITVDSATTALKNGAWYIFKQMHYKTPFPHNGYMKNLKLPLN
jgi:hypothetical protein